MLQATRFSRLRAPTSRWRAATARLFSSTSVSYGIPNPPLNLDSSMEALLKDVNMSLLNHKSQPPPALRELEVFAVDEADMETSVDIAAQDEVEVDYSHRKSPAALFGSQQVGAVVIPTQLQSSISLIIAEADRPALRSDAKRLFYDDAAAEEGQEDGWETQFDKKYRSRRQAAYHAERDGTAFVSIALPAHYSAITSVFDHLRRRMDPSWEVERVIDWGAGTGSGLWASLYAFQKKSADITDVEHLDISNSTVGTYLGIDKREGLVTIGKRLFQNVNMGKLSMLWQKSFREDDKIRRSEGHNTLALSAFTLSSLPNPLARKKLIKEIWESGAHTIVLIDHSTTSGFEAVAEAREYMLQMGRKEFQDPEADEWPIRGAHVVAPCPHDGECPLLHSGSSRLVCGFSQRMQRPNFVRRTKHSGVGHEDIEYSYVVIRRGARPSPTATSVGRVGDVGKRALYSKQSQVPPKELMLHDEHATLMANGSEHVDAVAADLPAVVHEDDEPQTQEMLYAALRKEAYQWPRLVFPPLKKSGHIILDSCTPEGKIMRITIPKSQGKQPYYDARKSSWGDIFPHAPKNPPQERSKGRGGSTQMQGSDIGKRKESKQKKDRASYESLSESIKETRKKSRRDRIDTRKYESYTN